MYSKKIIFSLISLFLLLGWFYASQSYDFTSGTTSANPDYICVKNVTDSPCISNSCDPWQTNGTRICHGTKATSVAYYLIRTSCEAGYTKISKWWNVWWNSGRNSPDYTYTSTACTITEVDNVAPIWVIWE